MCTLIISAHIIVKHADADPDPVADAADRRRNATGAI
jgi:hypothetical protein